MEIVFSTAELSNWADFSGDYNPIHFDVEKARLAGASDIIVHGMLTLLPVKQAVADALNARGRPDQGLKFRALFRSPVPWRVPQNVVLKDQLGERIGFRVLCSRERVERSRGWASPATPEQYGDDVPSAARRELSRSLGDLPAFVAIFPYVRNLWIWLDAVAFAELVRRHLPVPASWKAQEPGAADTAADIEAAQNLIVQTSQETFVAPRFAAMMLDASAGFEDESLTYCVGFLDTTVAAGDAFSAARMWVWIGDELAMRSEFGLLSKRVTQNVVNQ